MNLLHNSLKAASVRVLPHLIPLYHFASHPLHCKQPSGHKHPSQLVAHYCCAQNNFTLGFDAHTSELAALKWFAGLEALRYFSAGGQGRPLVTRYQENGMQMVALSLLNFYGHDAKHAR